MNPVELDQAAKHAVVVQASSLLNRALSAEAPDGSVLALGASIIFFLRRNGVRPGELVFQVCGGKEEA
jgi:hypothetical protein